MKKKLRSDADLPKLDSSEPDRPEVAGLQNDPIVADEATKAAASETFEQASDFEPIHASGDDAEEDDEDLGSEEKPPDKLERLQKILAQAGVASRRHAEELITQGRVQVNGKIVTELGTKADGGRDHIRVDGKLLQGSERLRYFMLNKPRGFVTTVKDPEGRPTTMEFFTKLRERVYPVGRLDYLSEGLLLVTNDGELANKLTRAAAGVEKTYLVKVSGEPTEENLDQLRRGVAIDRGKPGSGRVQTAPAQIRKVRQGDNPWYEVVLIEGRNRELRKMFEQIGHHVEKIRRVGYGPLVLDIEPGKMRELDPGELEDLRKAADGQLRKPKGKNDRQRKALEAQLPTIRSSHPDSQSAQQSGERPPFAPRREFPPKKQFGTDRPRPAREDGKSFRPKPGFAGKGPARFGAQRSSPPSNFRSDRPGWKKDDRSPRPPARFERTSAPQRDAQASAPRTERADSPRGDWQRPDRSKSRGFDRSGPGGPRRSSSGGSFGSKPRFDKPGRPDRPPFNRPAAPPRENSAEISRPPKPSRLHIEAVGPDQPTRPTSDRPPFGGASGSGGQARGRTPYDRPRSDQPGSHRPGSDRPRSNRPAFGRPKFERPAADPQRDAAREFTSARPPRREGSRPFTTSSGKPRPGGARPNNKRTGPVGKPGWKARPGATDKPASGPRSKPAFGSKPGGSSYKSKSSGGRSQSGPRSGGPRPGGSGRGGPRSGGPRPGGKRPGGKSGGGKKRG